MKNIFYIFLFLLFTASVQSQKLSWRCNFNAVQVQSWNLKERLLLDSTLYDGYRLYYDSLITAQKVVTEIPGLSLEFRFPSNWFVESSLNYSIFGFRGSYFSEDSLHVNTTFRLHRVSFITEGGYYFRKAKIFKPYFAAGLSINKMYAGVKSDYEKERFQVYKNYIKDAPYYLSLNFRAGVKFGALSVGFAFSTSITKTSADNKLGKYNHFTLFSISSDIIRTTSLKKLQYQSRFESDDFIVKKSQVLKQTENSWVFGLTYYHFVNMPYIVAYSTGTSDYRIEPVSPPRVAFIPTVGGKTVNAKNAKRTFYAQSNFNLAIINMNYKNVSTTTVNNPQTINSTNDPLSISQSDIKLSYFNMSFGAGHGFKIKTTPRTFIFAEYDARFYTNLNVDKKDIYNIPPLKFLFFTLGFESGFKFRHSGFSLMFMRSVGKLDKFSFYDKMGSLSLKFTYDISTK